MLRDELAAYVVACGAEPREAENLFQMLHAAVSGPLEIDFDEVRRTFDTTKASAESRLKAMRDQIVDEYGTTEGIVLQQDDYGLAWVEAF